MTFQKIVLFIALVILILMLAFVGVMLYRSKETAVWPPQVSECPDYWKVIGVNKCQNDKGLGNCTGVHDFSSAEWQGKRGLGKKKTWAKECNITWDGITNNTSI